MVWCRHERPSLETAPSIEPVGANQGGDGHAPRSQLGSASERPLDRCAVVPATKRWTSSVPNTVLIAPNRSSFITGDEDSADDYCTT